MTFGANPEIGQMSRRAVLRSSPGIALAGLAGCIGSATQSIAGDVEDPPTAVASFFTFFDYTRKIARGTPLEVNNLVPTGLHGHGWEPDPSITRDIVDADAFIHVGPDFQPWADRAIQTVIDDDTDTHLINVRAGVPLIDLADTVGDEEEVSDGKDPHFWLDPTLARMAVDNIADGLAEILPDYDDTFAENGQAVKAELDALDEEWEAIFDGAEREVVFLAAHNAFEYIGRRYEATIHPLVINLAATDDIRPADMRRARETIEANDIRYIGAAVFEPRRPAQQLLEETEVEGYFPVTPFAGVTEEWVAREWGYFEIARHINMETFKIVLGVAAPQETSLGEEWYNFD